jgi:hypothetical protein
MRGGQWARPEYRKFKRSFPPAACTHPVPCHLATLPLLLGSARTPRAARSGGALARACPRLPASPGAPRRPGTRGEPLASARRRRQAAGPRRRARTARGPGDGEPARRERRLGERQGCRERRVQTLLRKDCHARTRVWMVQRPYARAAPEQPEQPQIRADGHVGYDRTQQDRNTVDYGRIGQASQSIV